MICLQQKLQQKLVILDQSK